MPHYSDDAEHWLEGGARYVEDPLNTDDVVGRPVTLLGTAAPTEIRKTFRPFSAPQVLQPQQFTPAP